MFLQLRHQADDLMVLQRVSGFAGPLNQLGPVLAHVSTSSLTVPVHWLGLFIFME